MFLLVGLGNPGRSYAHNRHNIGFMAIEAIGRKHGFSAARSRFSGLVSEGLIKGERTILLQPQTYMNESGRSVGEAARFHKIGLENIIVLHDELDLAPAKCRIKTGGGVAGHNGLRSISAHIGNDYKRVRLGIGHPGDKSLVHHYVLNDFSKNEVDWVTTLCDAVADHADLLVTGDDAELQKRVHLALKSKGYDVPKSASEK
ncbi:MAG: aminoacyl-tRNA hydrolase [Methylocystis sp.]